MTAVVIVIVVLVVVAAVAAVVLVRRRRPSQPEIRRDEPTFDAEAPAPAGFEMPYAIEIANKGWTKAMQENKEIMHGANVVNGEVTYKAVAEAFDLPYTPIDTFL